MRHRYICIDRPRCRHQGALPEIAVRGYRYRTCGRQILLNSGATLMDKLRLVMLYALRFENDRERIRQLTYRLGLEGVDDQLIQSVNILLRYAGKSRLDAKCQWWYDG